MRFGTPVGVAKAASCHRDGEPVSVALCDIHPAGLRFETLICPHEDKSLPCHSANVPAPSDTSLVLWDGPSIVFVPGDHRPLMQELLRRLALGGKHPALPDSEALHSLHRQVLQNYRQALRLDDDLDAIHSGQDLHATWARQPQLCGAFRPARELRHEIWQGFLGNLADLGFPALPSPQGSAWTGLRA